MNTLAKYFGAGAMTCLITSGANAGTLPAFDESYEGAYKVFAGLSLDDLFDGNSQTVNNAWSRDPNTAETPRQFEYNDGIATLQFSMSNEVDTDTIYRLDIELHMTLNQVGGREPFCYEAWYDCSAASYLEAKDYFNFFDVTSATVSGALDLEGLEIALETKMANMPAQLGYLNYDEVVPGGKDILYFNHWVNYEVVSNTSGVAVNNSGYGDVFVNLVDTVPAVPLPAGSWLILTSIAGFASLKKRKSK